MTISFKEFAMTVNLLLVGLEPDPACPEGQFKRALCVRSQVSALQLLVQGNGSRGCYRIGKMLAEAHQKADKAVEAALEGSGG